MWATWQFFLPHYPPSSRRFQALSHCGTSASDSYRISINPGLANLQSQLCVCQDQRAEVGSYSFKRVRLVIAPTMSIPVNSNSAHSSINSLSMEATIVQTMTPREPQPKTAQLEVARDSQLSDSTSRIRRSLSRSDSQNDGQLDESPSHIKRSLSRSDSQDGKVPIEAWYYNPHSEEDPEEKDPTLPHRFNPDQQVSQEYLQTLGVLLWTALETKNYKRNPFLQKIKSERGYTYEEVVTVAPDRMVNYEENKKEFFKEHLHDHEEIRLILEGGGYEDIRDFDGKWIRIHIKRGVLIVLPKGMYHRFTVDNRNYLKALLLYQENPTRIQFERNAVTDVMEVREKYKEEVLSRGNSLKATSSDLANMLDRLDEELAAYRARLLQEQEQDEKMSDIALQTSESNLGGQEHLRHP